MTFWGTCECGWPLFSDGTCSDAECPLGWGDADEDDWEESA